MSKSAASYLKVKKGQITFDAEGNDIETSKNFSRVIQWPGNSLSGVTIGRGYDMGSRTKDAVYHDMVKAGIPIDTAKTLSKGAGLKGAQAKAFVDKNKKSIGIITHAQQFKLFEDTYPAYEKKARQDYNGWTHNQKTRVAWDKLDPAIRDVLVDLVYQGFTKGPKPMDAGMHNNYDEMIKYIKSSPVLMRYEPGRQRIKYLEKNMKLSKRTGAKK